ncbi:helix-turn-helix domain-containing protein [Paenibacillus dendritiformis]|uniref:helix-turn-helix domain-containing protein n=1 Tax=Paenibacillus dendritiformis TaxID=130049 RepID=UPI00365CC2F8
MDAKCELNTREGQKRQTQMMKDEHIAAAEQAIVYMKSHLEEEITSEQLAAHVGYSPYHFTRIFKSVTGISPRHYLSALRMESGKSTLLQEPSLLVKVLLSIGFRSAGSFNTRFKQQVGVPPRAFRIRSQALTAYMNEFEHRELTLPVPGKEAAPQITCRIEAPASFRGLIFVGLFPHPIPDQRPVAGTALAGGKRTCVFADVPSGTYYALAAGIPWSLRPKDYFVLDRAIRGKYPSAIEVNDRTELGIAIQLRNPLPYDPPIVVSLPQLLFEKKKESNTAK